MGTGMKDISTLIELYCELVHASKDVWIKSEVKKSKELQKKVSRLFEEIVINGDDSKLIELLSSEDRWIQRAAAIHVLEINEQEALRVLNEIINDDVPYLADLSRMVIDFWNAGELRFRGKIIVNGILENKVKLPFKVSFTDIKEFEKFEKFEDRFYAVGDILGMFADAVEFCPNNTPPSKDELLAWLWVIKPEYSVQILESANDELRQAIEDYLE